jgi:hypothetical protein
MAVAYARDTADQWERLTGSAILPGTVSDADADRFFDQAGTEIASGSASGEVDVTKSKRTTRGGMPALDLWLKDSNGAPGRMRIMLWGAKLYMYGVFATRGTDRLFHALDDSFAVR